MLKKNMNIKKSLTFLFILVFLCSFVISQEYKSLDISIISEDKIISPGENIKLIITLYDENNNPVEADIEIVIKDLKEVSIKKATIKSKVGVEEIELPEDAIAGEGKIIAKYNDLEATESFFVSENKVAKFEIDKDTLVITNIGNTIYDKPVYITIGETTGKKTPQLEIGEKISYKLVAPDGVYNIKITDGTTSLTQGEVQLVGTGRAVGALDETSSKRSPITGGISPDEESEGALLSYIKRSKFVYVFVLIVFGVMVLLTIERRYRKKLEQ